MNAIHRFKHPVPYDSHPELPLDPDAALPGVYKWPPHLAPGLQATVFAGGCAGTLARYGVAAAIPARMNGWPWATFAVNLAGAFLLGVLLETLLRRGEDKGRLRLLRLGIGTGFIGAFTTYSTLAVETDLFIKNSHPGMAAAYAVSSLAGGMLMSAFGIQAAARRHRSRTGNAS